MRTQKDSGTKQVKRLHEFIGDQTQFFQFHSNHSLKPLIKVQTHYPCTFHHIFRMKNINSLHRHIHMFSPWDRPISLFSRWQCPHRHFLQIQWPFCFPMKYQIGSFCRPPVCCCTDNKHNHTPGICKVLIYSLCFLWTQNESKIPYPGDWLSDWHIHHKSCRYSIDISWSLPLPLW